jgi:hypothetical protein
MNAPQFCLVTRLWYGPGRSPLDQRKSQSARGSARRMDSPDPSRPPNTTGLWRGAICAPLSGGEQGWRRQRAPGDRQNRRTVGMNRTTCRPRSTSWRPNPTVADVAIPAEAHDGRRIPRAARVPRRVGSAACPERPTARSPPIRALDRVAELAQTLAPILEGATDDGGRRPRWGVMFATGRGQGFEDVDPTANMALNPRVAQLRAAHAAQRR